MLFNPAKQSLRVFDIGYFHAESWLIELTDRKIEPTQAQNDFVSSQWNNSNVPWLTASIKRPLKVNLF